MRKGLVLLLTLVVMLAVACDGGGDNDGGSGSGNVITEERDVSGFDKVLMTGSGIAEIIQGDTESLVVEAEDNIMPSVESEVENGVLVLGQKSGTTINPTEPVRYTVTMIDVAGLEITGSGAINSDSIDANIITLGISGSGGINIVELDGDSVDMTISGSGGAWLSGDVADQVVEIGGSGEYRAADLHSGTAVVTIGGSGDAVVWVDTTLDVNISGSGGISYYGDPILTQSVSGSGEVESLGER
ncbi:MAG: DUF2807 domain-containing protein [Chloroflexota bacterium]|nr:MAG: DUF2807 domain-containing protein [Chloroflexota bacterium]